jgi:hypothetical protein
MNKIFVILLVFVCVLFLFGCTENNDTISNSSDEEAFQQFLSSFSDLPDEYMVKYKLDAGELASGMDIEYTIYYKSGDYRFDADMDLAKTKLWVTNEKGVLCTETMFLNESDCIILDSDDIESQEQVGRIDITEFEENAKNYAINLLSPRTIAGETSTCFKVKAINSNVDSEFCVTNGGILTYMSTKTGEKIEMAIIAKEISRTVSNSDMIPPEV